MNLTKSLRLNSYKEIRFCMSTKAKPPNHYETLNVNQDCTQEEIKSAYYDLTKKYHPDKNTTKEAKTKFQDVSNAYEVLGNFHKRKLYDRDLLARGGKAARSTDYTVPQDRMSGFYKSRSANVNATKTEDFQNFDFDAWTRAHYDRTFKVQTDRQRRIDERILFRAKLYKQDEKELHSSLNFTVVTAGVICFFLMLQSFIADTDYDKNSLQSPEKNQKSS